MSKHVTLAQFSNGLRAIADHTKTYAIKQQATADEGYASTYQLFETSNTGTESAVGPKINIPKDMVVEHGEVKTVTTADVPYSGAVVGDKYIDITIANKAQNHLYIPVKDLVDVYTAGNGLSLSNGQFSVTIDSTSSNGLSVGANGVSMALATPSASGVGGAAGAMSPTDKEKLDGFTEATDAEVQAIIDGLFTNSSNNG